MPRQRAQTAIAKEAKRSERGARLPGVLLPLRGRRGRCARGGRRLVPGVDRRRRTARAAAAERQRQAADAADTSPRHHSPSLDRQLFVQAYLLHTDSVLSIIQKLFAYIGLQICLRLSSSRGTMHNISNVSYRKALCL